MSETVNRRKLAGRVRRAITRLAEPAREVVLMLDIEGLSRQKVHEILGAGGLTESQL